MSDVQSAARLALARLERLLKFRSAGPEFDELSDRVQLVRRKAFADNVLTSEESAGIIAETIAVSRRYDELATASGAAPSGIPAEAEQFRLYSEYAEIQFSHLAGSKDEHFRAGLLRDYRQTKDTAASARRIALDIDTSASAEIAAAKVHLLRAAISLEESEDRRRELLGRVRSAVRQFPEIGRQWAFHSTAAEVRTTLPDDVRGTNAQMPNRPLPGWEEENARAVRDVLDRMSAAGALFVDQLQRSSHPRSVAMKLDLNMGIEGPPSVSDPVVTGAVLYELLERGFAHGTPLRFTVGDSCGIENAPIGRTSMDILHATGNFHYAIKATLRFLLRRDDDPARRDRAADLLNRIAALESAGAFFGRLTVPAREVKAAEEITAPWLRCVDYDETGFIRTRTDLGPLGRAVWGTRDFEIARLWVEADHRVHVTRGTSTHLFAHWTGALKGLIGLHALGMRPADQGMNERGQTALDFLLYIMHSSGIEAVIRRKGAMLEAAPPDERWLALQQSPLLAAGWAEWVRQTTALELDLRKQLAAGTPETEVMAKMRRSTRAILDDADEASPGFRDAMWSAVAEGTRRGLLMAWRMRSLLPRTAIDEAMGMKIGVLSQLPVQAQLVVQGLPKIGMGGGPDAYETVHDVGVVIAATDEATTDLAALRAAGIPGNPWAYNFPIHGAVQFGRGPAMWDEIAFAH